MKYFLQKEKLTSSFIAGSLLTVFAFASPQVLAHDAAAERIKLLEQRLQAIQSELEKVKSESSRAVQKVNTIEQTTNQTVQKVNDLEERKAAFVERVDPITKRIGVDVTEKTRMLFFRGGFAHVIEGLPGFTIVAHL